MSLISARAEGVVSAGARARLDVLPGKLRVPRPHPGSVPRSALVNRLRATRAPVVTLVAPAGYGKTTVVAQWVDRDSRPCAWITLHERDDDPIVFARTLAAAIDPISALDPLVLDALARPARSVWTKLVPRLAEAIASCDPPPIIVLDEIDRIRSCGTLEIVATLVGQLPPEAILVLSSRSQPDLPIPTLRAEGRLFEVGPDELALSPREAERLFAAAGVEPSPEERVALLERTEGWPVGVYLAARAAAESPDRGARLAFAGDDRAVADYLRLECLGAIPPERLAFLRRTAILARMSGPLCDAVLGGAGSARALEELEATGLLLVPLDRRREWFRYHHLLRDLLRHDLQVHEPELVPTLHARAAAWLETGDDRGAAVWHWLAAGEADRAAALVADLVLPACDEGRLDEAEAWLDCFDEPQLRRHPALAVLGAWIHLLHGREEAALARLALSEAGADAGPMPDGAASAQPWIAVVRAALCREGAARMAEDADAAVDGLPGSSDWMPLALALQGVAQSLEGDLAAADATLRRAANLALERGASTALAAAVAQRALIAMNLDEHARAQLLALEAVEVAPTAARVGEGALELALSARALLRCGRFDEAHAELTAAEARRAAALPWLAVQTSIELGRARLTLRDLEGARDSLGEAREVLRRHPDLGTLGAEVEAVARTATAGEKRAGRGRLTAAELRLLPLLATHLSFREIGAQFFVSRNTIKTQAISVYRKLGVSSRSEAIERATQLGLLG